ncbi:hypothetical protein C4573_02560 [Candidatus Woesearchaeota archaeon]|nr:MAG: hypothetical protein C4573_02560 [Candidatus Woesearchaeota archaeon]
MTLDAVIESREISLVLSTGGRYIHDCKYEGGVLTSNQGLKLTITRAKVDYRLKVQVPFLGTLTADIEIIADDFKDMPFERDEHIIYHQQDTRPEGRISLDAGKMRHPEYIDNLSVIVAIPYNKKGIEKFDDTDKNFLFAQDAAYVMINKAISDYERLKKRAIKVSFKDIKDSIPKPL